MSKTKMVYLEINRYLGVIAAEFCPAKLQKDAHHQKDGIGKASAAMVMTIQQLPEAQRRNVKPHQIF